MMRFQPHLYQIEAIKFLLQNSHAALFFDPGLGKTACVLTALTVLKRQGMMRRALVVAPRRVANNVWPVERTKWAEFMGLTMDVLHGAHKDKLLERTTADICVVTPEGLQWIDNNGLWSKVNADVLVVDESSYFRHTTSKRFKTLKAVLPRFKRRIILTGTPAPRGYEDLFSQIYIVDQGGSLGRYITHYRNLYFEDHGYGYPDWRLRPGADKEINRKIAPLVLRGDAVDHLDMPKLVHNTVRVTLPTKARETYDDFERNFYVAMDGQEVIAPNAAVAVNKLRQAANGFMYPSGEGGRVVELHTEKLEAVSALLDDLQGQSALILYEYQHDLNMLLQLIPRAQYIGGGTTDKQAEAAIKGFNDGSIPVLLAHPASAGHGINIQDCAQHIIWYGPTWNLEHFDQAIARVWRQGNPHERVFVHTIVVADSVEETVAKVLAGKDRTQRALLAALKRPQDVVPAAAPTTSALTPTGQPG
jgi:hypothetical protein